MKLISAALMGGLIAVAGAVLYDTTFEVQELEGQLSRLNRQIVAEREVIQILKADWSVLNDIARIEQMSVKHLPGLRPAEAQQFAALTAVPRQNRDGTSVDPQFAGLVGKVTAPAPPATAAKPAAGKGTALPLPTPTPPRDGIGSLISTVGGVR
jgi:hypothetical protein